MIEALSALEVEVGRVGLCEELPASLREPVRHSLPHRFPFEVPTLVEPLKPGVRASWADLDAFCNLCCGQYRIVRLLKENENLGIRYGRLPTTHLACDCRRPGNYNLSVNISFLRIISALRVNSQARIAIGNGDLLRACRYATGPTHVQEECGPGATTPVRVGPREQTTETMSKSHTTGDKTPHDTDESTLTQQVEYLIQTAETRALRLEHAAIDALLEDETGGPTCPVCGRAPALGWVNGKRICPERHTWTERGDA